MFKKVSKIFAAGLVVVLAMGLMTGCGKVDGTKTAITVNEDTISLGTANAYIRYQQCSNYYYLSAYGYVSEGSTFWDYEDEETGETYGETYKEQWKENLIQMAVLRQHAEEYGVTVSDEEKTKISEAAAEFVSANGSVADWIGADQAAIEDMLELIYIQDKMHDPMIADVDTEVSDEEAAQKTITYSYISYTAEEDYTDEETSYEDYKAGLVAQCEQLIDELNEDSTSEMSDLATAISEDFTTTTSSYGSDTSDTSFDETVIEAANTLSDGEVYQEVLDNGSYLYVIKMVSTFDEEATETEKANIVSERQETAYDELLDSWVEAADTTVDSCFDALKVTDKEIYKFKEA